MNNLATMFENINSFFEVIFVVSHELGHAYNPHMRNNVYNFLSKYDDLNNLINYHNIFYDIEWLKKIVISLIYESKINTDGTYSEEGIGELKRIVDEYLLRGENRKNK